MTPRFHSKDACEKVTSTRCHEAMVAIKAEIMKRYKCSPAMATKLFWAAMNSAVMEEPLMDQIHFLVTGMLDYED